VTSLGLADGQPYWFKFAWTAAGGFRSFYIADDEPNIPTTWTTLTNNATTAPTGALFTGTSVVVAGSGKTGFQVPTGVKNYRSIVRSAVGGANLLDARFDTPFTSRFRDPGGHIWTLNGSTWAWMRGKA